MLRSIDTPMALSSGSGTPSPVIISVVLPAYNNADHLPFLIRHIGEVLSTYGNWEILVVDDGSTDTTIPLLKRLRQTNLSLRYLSFSRRFGQQAALRAGYEHARGACVISLDVSDQHPPQLIRALLNHWQRGFEVVSIRRQPDPPLPGLKQILPVLFHGLRRAVSAMELLDGETDFRLLDRKVVDALKQHGEADLFLRGTVAWMGFRQIRLTYQSAPGFGGRRKSTFWKSVHMALGGITSTTRPLHLSVVLGCSMSLLAAGLGLEVLYEKFFTQRTVSGWTSLVLLLLLLGGIQFILMGIIGIYLGKTFEEAKGRPPYLIAETDLASQTFSNVWDQPVSVSR